MKMMANQKMLSAFLVPVLFWVVTLGAVRALVVPPEGCGDVDAGMMRDAAMSAAEWLVRGQGPDGRYTYLYNRETGDVPNDYNIVRHAGVTMSLYQVAGRLGSDEALAAADRGLDWMLANLRDHDDWSALADTDRVKLGASGLMLVALAERRLATGDRQYDDVMQRLGRFIVALQREDGGFWIAWDFARQEPDRVGTSAYYPGEALWGLALLHEALPDARVEEAAWRAADYITLRRDEVEDVPFPPLHDHWLAYGLAEMAEWRIADHHIDYARRVAGRFSLFIRVEAQKADDGMLGFLRGGPIQSSALGTWVEGSAALWRLAAQDARMDDLTGRIAARAACGAGVLIQRQAPADADRREAGAWFVDGVTRMDDQQHAISGLLYTADALEGRTRRAPDAATGTR